VFAFNAKIQTPTEVERYVNSRGGFSNSQLKIMVSGDAWDPAKGFHLQHHSYFAERDQHLERYRTEQQEKLEATYRAEARITVRLEDVQRFFGGFFKAVPWLVRRTFRRKPIVFCARTGKDVACFAVDLATESVTLVSGDALGPEVIRYETTASILKMAMALNMFSHIGISKRVRYRSRKEDRRYLVRLNTLLAAYEYEVLPLRSLFRLRTFHVYARRWREVMLAIQFVIGLLRGKTGHQLEEQFLT
jgi:UDP-MurNAc hydroxylase